MLLNRHRNRRTNGVTSLKDVAPVEVISLEEMTAEELKAYAEENGIDIGKATSQEGILKKIQEAIEETTE